MGKADARLTGVGKAEAMEATEAKGVKATGVKTDEVQADVVKRC